MVTTAKQKQTIPPTRTYLPIEDYGIIGDLHTVALVGKNGSIDWYCVPAFDAPSVFGALLDAEKGGYFQIEPGETPVKSHKQHYLPDTNVLVTRFPDGKRGGRSHRFHAHSTGDQSHRSAWHRAGSPRRQWLAVFRDDVPSRL